MKRLITFAFAMLLLPAVAAATPSKWTDTRTDVDETMKGPEWFTCNTGSPTTLLVGAAAVGLLLRRRR